MATPMTHTQFKNLLKQWSIPTIDNSRGDTPWYKHNRNDKGLWGGVNGIGNHHTGAKDNKAGRDVLWYGYNGLPGPLCHAGITPGGDVLLNGWGRCNHMGLGDGAVLSRVVNEDYEGALLPKIANTDGNRRFYGFEWMYEGNIDPRKEIPEMYETAVRLNAAICAFHKWTPKSCIGHGEWQPGKWDPGYKKGTMLPMVAFRDDVEQAMKDGPKIKAPEKKPPLPQRPVNPVPAKPGSIIVKNGDTLWGLAEKHLGDGNRWLEFVSANQKLIVLSPGDVLKIPKK